MTNRFIVLFAIIFTFAVTGFGQTASTPTRIALMNTEMFFDQKAGVTKLLNAYSALNAEFKPSQDELNAIKVKIDNLTRELKTIQDQLNSNVASLDVKALQAQYSTKMEEGGRLERDFKFKQENAKSRYDRRVQEATSPVLKELNDAIEAYRKANNYDIILDYGKMEGSLLAANPLLDVTTQFIKDFNTKSSAAPRP